MYVASRRRQYKALKPLTLLNCKLSLITDQQIQISQSYLNRSKAVTTDTDTMR